MDVFSILLLLHLFGIVIGAGGAYASDFMFLKAIKDVRITHTEMQFLELGSRMVWIGLAMLMFSGIGLVLLNPEMYLQSPKFLAKMTVVLAIVANGIFFHVSHIPRMKRHVQHHLPSSDEFIRKTSFLMGSGAVSLVSWTSAVILGGLRFLPYSYPQIIGVYILALLIAVGVALWLRPYVFPVHRESR